MDAGLRPVNVQFTKCLRGRQRQCAPMLLKNWASSRIGTIPLLNAKSMALYTSRPLSDVLINVASQLVVRLKGCLRGILRFDLDCRLEAVLRIVVDECDEAL